MSADGPGRRLADKCLGALPARLRTAGALIGLLLVLGLGLRAYHYLRDPSLWHDEAALVLNVIGKGFGELLGPLLFSEAAPPLFLWAERAVVLLLGDGTYALRLLPFLASCAALLLFVPAARGLLRPAAVPWAVFLFACNDHLLWHASEAKPYSIDVLAATALAALWCRTRGWPLERQALLYAALAPFVIFLVYPGCFLCGGLLLALLPALGRARARLTAWLAYGALALGVGAAFLLLYVGPARAQRSTAMEQCWVDAFPPWGRPWDVPHWALRSTLDVLRYCCEPAGNVLALLLFAGAVALWRRGARAALVLLLAPAGLALAASFVGGYPYTGGRVLVYLTPAVVLLIAEGVPPALAWLRDRSRWAAVPLVLVLLAPLGLAAVNAAFPGGRADNAGATAYVLAERRPGDVIAGNAWEHVYYFRHLGAAFVPDRRVEGVPAGRLWVVVSGLPPAGREEKMRWLAPGGWQVVRRREFAKTTVFLLQPPHSQAPAGATAQRAVFAGEGPHE